MFTQGHFSNHWLLFGVTTMALLQMIFTHSTTINHLFGNASLELVEWVLALMGGLIISSVVGAEKWLHHGNGNNN